MTKIRILIKLINHALYYYIKFCSDDDPLLAPLVKQSTKPPMSHFKGVLEAPSLPPHLVSTSLSSTDLSHSEQEDEWPPECNIIIDNLSYPAVSLDGCAPINHETVPTTPSSPSSSSIPVLNIEDIEGLSAWQRCRHTCITCGRFTGPLLIFSFFCIAFIALGRGYLSELLNWLENLPLVFSLSVFVLLFTIISFPFGFGYIILNMAAGYLYGMLRGQAVVTVSVAIGFMIGFVVCRCCMREWAGQYIASSPALLAMTKVVEGPHGFKVILLTRLTPIPFGLQNALFAVSMYM